MINTLQLIHSLQTTSLDIISKDKAQVLMNEGRNKNINEAGNTEWK